MAPPPVDTSRGRQRLQRNVQSFIVSSVCIFVRVALSRDPRKKRFVISGSAKEGDSIGVSLGCNQGSKTAWRRHDCKKKNREKKLSTFRLLRSPDGGSQRETRRVETSRQRYSGMAAKATPCRCTITPRPHRTRTGLSPQAMSNSGPRTRKASGRTAKESADPRRSSSARSEGPSFRSN